MKESIFNYTGDKLIFRDIFYKMLMSGQNVTYEQAVTEYYKTKGITCDFTKTSFSDEPFYRNTAKKVVSDLLDTLRKYGCVIREEKVKQKKVFTYDGIDRDPLKNIKFQALLERRFEEIENCIKHKQPFQITYKPFDRGTMEIIFHPHLLTCYNGRAFVFGVSEREGKTPKRQITIALDRIQGKIRGTDSSIKYIPANADEYSYLDYTVGVTKNPNVQSKERIRLRALDKYTFGRLITKPLHWTQKTMLRPDFNSGRTYGEVEIEVFPNVELQGQILSYGKNLVVISPDSYRKVIEEEIRNMAELYENQ